MTRPLPNKGAANGVPLNLRNPWTSVLLPWLLCTRKDARKAGLRKSGQRTIRFEALLVGKTLLFKAPPDISFEIGSLALNWVYRQRIQDCRILTAMLSVSIDLD